MKKQFCKQGHDIFIFGRFSNGTCKKCTSIRTTKWKRANQDKVRITQKKWNEVNKHRVKIVTKKWRKKNPWVENYSAAKQRCNNPKHISYPNYGAKGVKFLMTVDEFKLLYKRDHAEFMVRPSIERINRNGNYELSNCEFVEWSENLRRRNGL